MLKIGQFSRFSRVPAKTLRYYDEIGLLTPAHIDTFTGYRYYAADQLTRLNRILAFKELGLSLEQIAQLLDENLSAAQIGGMLRLKQIEVQQTLDESQARLGRIESLLRLIEREGMMPDGDVTIKKVAPQIIISARLVAPSVEFLKNWFNEQYGRIYRFMGENNLKDGACMAMYHDDPDIGYHTEDIDSEAVVVVESGTVPSSLPDGVMTRTLEGTETMASLVHKGSFDTITDTYTALIKWIAANGYHIVGPVREIYVHVPPGADESTYITEIQYPVERL
jgi:DNA-binding transcriptional MerR regulator